jgi:hypothetical protein
MNKIGFCLIAIFAFLPIIGLVGVLAYDLIVERKGGWFADPKDFEGDGDYHL